MPGEFYIEDQKVKNDITEIKNSVTQVQNISITQVQSDVTEIKSSLIEVSNQIAKLISSIDLWSSYSAQVQLAAGAGDKSLPSITIAGLPAGAAIVRAVMMLKYRTIENTNAAVNSLSSAQDIQAEKAVGGAWVTGIALGGGECSVPASTRESGDVMIGTNDIASEIPTNGDAVDFKWANAKSAQDNLNFNDVQVGLRIWFTV